MPCAGERAKGVDRGSCTREPRLLPQGPGDALQLLALFRMPCVPSDGQGAMLRVSPLCMAMADSKAPRLPYNTSQYGHAHRISVAYHLQVSLASVSPVHPRCPHRYSLMRVLGARVHMREMLRACEPPK